MKERIKFLEKEISKHDYLYYVKSNPEISDKEYDLLFKELQDLEAEYPEYKSSNSPTSRIGSDKSEGFEQIEHTRPMLSLSNTYSGEEILDFDKRVKKLLQMGGEDANNKIKYCVELKIDGVAISLHYKNAELSYALTRGDGIKGDEVSSNVRTINDIKLSDVFIAGGFAKQNDFELRGEVFLDIKTFEWLNNKRKEEGLPLFANPRNTASGSLKMLDSREVSKRKLKMISYYLDSETMPLPDSHFERIKLLAEAGFSVSSHTKLCENISEVFGFLEKWDKEKSALPFQIDGVVIKLDSVSLQKKLGFAGRSPRWAIAYKFDSESVETELIDITLQIGRQGTITPVAELRPVAIGGTIVKRASLYNQDYISSLDIRIGDIVKVEKGGEIIPKITEVVLEKRPPSSVPFSFPDSIDGIAIEKKEGEANFYLKENQESRTQIEKKIVHFASRNALDIDSLGEKVISSFIKFGFIKNIPDIYLLDKYREQILLSDGWGDRSWDKLQEGIEASKSQSFHRLIFGLGIRHVGLGGARILAGHFQNIDNLMSASYDDLISIPEIGKKIASSVVDYFDNENNCSIIARLKSAGLNLQVSNLPKGGEGTLRVATDDGNYLEVKSFVFTGTLEGIGRAEAEELLRERGGKVSSSISSKTSYLVAGDKPGSKLKRAKKFGVETLNKEEFQRLLKIV